MPQPLETQFSLILPRNSICGNLFHSIDWSQHPLGPVEAWPIALKCTLNILFHSRHPMFIWWGPELYQFYNDAYLPSFGIGKHPTAMGQRGEDCWPETWPIIKPQIDLVMKTGGATWHEEQLVPIFRNGRIEDVYWTYGYSPIFNEDGTIGGTLVVCNETTNKVENDRALKEANRRIEAQRSRLESIFKQAPVPIAVVEGPEHRFRFVNDLYAQTFLLEKNYLGKTAEELIPGWRAQGFIGQLDHVYKTGNRYVGKEVPFYFTGPKRETKNFYLNLVYEPLRNSENEIEGVLAVINDVTEQVELRRGVEAAKQEAENANNLKTAFLANMSHEIRTPLVAILGFADILKNRTLTSKEAAQYLEIISRNGHALTRIIDDILDLSKIEAGKLKVEKAPLSLYELTREVLAMFSDLCSAKGIELRLDETGFPKIMVDSDAVRIRQVLINLIGNAIKFTSQGHVTVKGTSQELDDQSLRVRFTISDTGIGLDSTQAARLFSPFTQGDSNSSRRFGGTGLGLALSKKLGQALGGDVTLENFEAGKGCTFAFEIVCQRSQAKEAGSRKDLETTGLAPPKKLNGVKVLVVDDAPDNRTLIEFILKYEGAEVDLAPEGEVGVRMALEKDYDVVLMDIQMPGTDGYKALEKLREKNYSKPVIALTAHAMLEERTRAIAAGFHDHIAKPINPKKLTESLLLYSKINSKKESYH